MATPVPPPRRDGPALLRADGFAGAARIAPPRRIADQPAPQVTAQHVAVIDDASGALLYGVDPMARVAPASVTKIATTVVALERATDLHRDITVAVSAGEMVARDGSSVMGLEPGQHVTLETLLYGMMLPSGNDAADQVALALAGSRERFVGWMNEAAGRLGLQNTRFTSPSGMDSLGHYSSAYDMVMFARYGMRTTTFRTLASSLTYTGDGFILWNLNRLLGWYPGADGVKVGFTDDAGKTIVASAVHDGHRVYVGLMHSRDLTDDSRALFDWVWQTYRWQ